MRKMARLIGVAVILATLAMSQSTLMAAPYVGATKASTNSGLTDRLLDILTAIWGGGSNDGHTAVWGGTQAGGHTAVWGGTQAGSHTAVWGGTGNGGSH
jgi:hypothetical protein